MIALVALVCISPVLAVVTVWLHFATIVSQVSSLMSLIPVIAKGVESVNSIGEVLLEEDIECNDGKEALDSIEGEFDFKNVRFAYNNTDKPVLHELNLHVNKGETIALVGESGAGKSTILNLVIGFNFATDGVVTIDGHDMRDIDLRSYRKHLAVVPQTSILFSGTIRDNITYGIDDFDEEALNKVVDAANLRDLIDSLPDGLDTVVVLSQSFGRRSAAALKSSAHLLAHSWKERRGNVNVWLPLI